MTRHPSHDVDARDIAPWYRQFWPWFLIALPAAVVIASIVTLTIAARSPHSMVVDDYRKDGFGIEALTDRDRRAAELGLAATLRAETNGRLTVSVSPAAVARESELVLIFAHPTLATRDQRVRLEWTGESWEGEVPALGDFRWLVQLQPADGGDWRLVADTRGQVAEVQLRPRQVPAGEP